MSNDSAAPETAHERKTRLAALRLVRPQTYARLVEMGQIKQDEELHA